MNQEFFSVWVGGVEVNNYFLTESEAKSIAEEWIAAGYDDCQIEKVEG